MVDNFDFRRMFVGLNFGHPLILFAFQDTKICKGDEIERVTRNCGTRGKRQIGHIGTRVATFNLFLYFL